MVGVRSQHSTTQGNMQIKQLNGGINHNHTFSTQILINIIANLVMICRIYLQIILQIKVPEYKMIHVI